MKLEREVKLAAWGGFAVPPLDDVAPDVSAAPLKTKKLDATYYDTRDLRLARAGVSLRHRVGDDPPWTVKLPEGEAGPVMSRREFPFAGPAGAVPAEAAALVRAYARSNALARIVGHDPGVRLGDDPEDVHQARVGTRRLRSDLRTFRPLLDPEWVAGLREEAGWYAGLLGEVRDVEVLMERLEHQAHGLPKEDSAAVTPIVGRLAKEREAARSRLLAGMDSPRYIALLDRLSDA